MKTWSMRFSSMTRCSSAVSPSTGRPAGRRSRLAGSSSRKPITSTPKSRWATSFSAMSMPSSPAPTTRMRCRLPACRLALRSRPRIATRSVDDRDELEGGEESEEGAAVGEVLDASGRERRPVPGRDAGEQDRAEDDRQQDRDGLVDAGAIEALAVEAVEVEDDREEHQRDRQELDVAPEVRRVLGQRDDFELEAQGPGTEEGERGGRQIAEQVRRRGDSESLLDQLDSPSDSGQKGRRYPFRRVVNRSAENSSARLRRSMGLNCIRWILSIPAASDSTPGSSTRSPSRPLLDDVQDAALAERQDRRAAGQGLDRRDAEILNPCLQIAAGRSSRGGGAPPARPGRRSGSTGRRPARRRARSGPSPTTTSGTPGPAAGLDRDIHFFVWRQGGDHQDESARGARRVGRKKAVSTGGGEDLRRSGRSSGGSARRRRSSWRDRGRPARRWRHPRPAGGRECAPAASPTGPLGGGK